MKEKNIAVAAVILLFVAALISCGRGTVVGHDARSAGDISISPIGSFQTPDYKIDRSGSDVRVMLSSSGDGFARIAYNADAISYKGLESASSGWSTDNAIAAVFPAGEGLLDFGAVQFKDVHLPGQTVLVFTCEPDKHPWRSVSLAPTSDESAVVDFTMSDNGAGGANCTWRYRNAGDYDQGGEVGVPDITPIAQNYLETVSSDPDDPNAPIDGDGSGEIGVPDITPIAQNYLRVLTDYELQYSADGSDGSYTQLAVIGRDLGVEPDGGGRLKFDQELTWAANGFYRVVPHDSADDGYGIPGNVVEWQDGFVVTLTISLSTTGVAGAGSADDPYVLDAAQPFQFVAMQGETNVTDQVAWISSPEFAVSWSATTPGATDSILDIAGDFSIYCTLGNETSNTIYCRKHIVGP